MVNYCYLNIDFNSRTPVDKVAHRDDENMMIDKILKTGTQLQLTLHQDQL